MTGAWKFSVTPFFCVGIYQLVKRGPHTQQYYHSFQLDALHYAQCSFGFELWISKIYFGKDKSPEFPFHGTTSSYSYFEVIWILAPIKQEEKHDQRKLQLNRNKKFFDKAQQFLVFLHKTWFVVNLSHLYSVAY